MDEQTDFDQMACVECSSALHQAIPGIAFEKKCVVGRIECHDSGLPQVVEDDGGRCWRDVQTLCQLRRGPALFGVGAHQHKRFHMRDRRDACQYETPHVAGYILALRCHDRWEEAEFKSALA